ESMQVQIVGVAGDKVRLGIAAPNNVSVQREELSTPARRPRAAETVPHEIFLDWIARQIEQYLAAHPEVTLQQLARAVGVSPATITRWKARQTNIAKAHLQSLLDVLGIGLDDLARERNVQRILPPDVKARGPTVRRRL